MFEALIIGVLLAVFVPFTAFIVSASAYLGKIWILRILTRKENDNG